MYRLAAAFVIFAGAPAVAATPVANGALKVGVTVTGAASGVASSRTVASSQLQQAPSRTFVECSEGACVRVIYY